MNEKTNMFIVIKKEDIFKYLTDAEQQNLANILDKVANGRSQDNKNSINYYYVCNLDEPYANVVHDVIIGGEMIKTNNLPYNQDACGSNSSDLYNRNKIVSWNTFICGESELHCESLEDAQLLLKVCNENKIDCDHVNPENYIENPYWYIINNKLYIAKYAYDNISIYSCWTVKAYIVKHTSNQYI